MVGLGTWGDGLIFFEYPDTLFYISLLLLAGAVALIGPLRLLWGAYRQEEEPPEADLRRAAAIGITVAVGTVAVLLLTLLVLLPSLEEQTIWLGRDRRIPQRLVARLRCLYRHRWCRDRLLGAAQCRQHIGATASTA